MKITQADWAAIEIHLKDTTWRNLFVRLLQIGTWIQLQCPVIINLPRASIWSTWGWKKAGQPQIRAAIQPSKLSPVQLEEVRQASRQIREISETLSWPFPKDHRHYWQNVLYAWAFDGYTTIEQFKSGGRPRRKSPRTIRQYRKITQAYYKACQLDPDLTQREHCRRTGIAPRTLRRAIKELQKLGPKNSTQGY